MSAEESRESEPTTKPIDLLGHLARAVEKAREERRKHPPTGSAESPARDDQVTPKDAGLIAYALSVAVGDGWIDTPPEQQRAMELQAHFDKLSNEGS